MNVQRSQLLQLKEYFHKNLKTLQTFFFQTRMQIESITATHVQAMYILSRDQVKGQDPEQMGLLTGSNLKKKHCPCLYEKEA